MREVAEEAGIKLPDAGALVKFSRWITPEAVRIRFDTHFFLARGSDGAEPRPTAPRRSTSAGSRPQDALEAGARGEIMLVFPTMKTLEQLGRVRHRRRSAGLGARVARSSRSSRGGRQGETARIVLPGEPGYEG